MAQPSGHTWFTRGVEALQRVRPAVPDGFYCCPICLRGFDSPEALSLEDVPPASVGGRPICLTCTDCNNRSGYTIDHHAATAAKLRAFAKGELALPGTIDLAGYRVTTSINQTEKGLSIAGIPERSNPEHHTGLFDHLKHVAATGETDWTFDLTFHVKYNARLENIVWIRSAYLVAFAVLGYTYVLRPELDLVRTQILEPMIEHIPFSEIQIPGADQSNEATIVFEPAEFRSIMVRFGTRCVFLPDFTADQSFFANLHAIAASDRTSARFVGPALKWPVRPLYGLDFDPTGLAVCIPQSLSWWRSTGQGSS